MNGGLASTTADRRGAPGRWVLAAALCCSWSCGDDRAGARIADASLNDARAVLCEGAPAPAVGLGCGCEGGGTIGCDGSCSALDDICVPAGEWYRVGNAALGVGRALEIGAAAASPTMAPASDSPGQRWKILPLGDGSYRLSSSSLGDGAALAASVDGGLRISTTAEQGQGWTIRAIDGKSFRLTNALLGDARALGLDPQDPNRPRMVPVRDDPGQAWTLHKVVVPARPLYEPPPGPTPLAGCAEHATVAAFEQGFLVRRCAQSEGCHVSSSALATDFESAQVTDRLLNTIPKGACKDDRLIDGGDHARSLMLVKTEPDPRCPTGAGEAGEQMPLLDSLTAAERSCLRAYVEAVAQGSRARP